MSTALWFLPLLLFLENTTGSISGSFESFDNGVAVGFAQQSDSSLPILVDIYVNQTKHARILADHDGHNFTYTFPTTQPNFRVDIYAFARPPAGGHNATFPLDNSPRTSDPTFSGLPAPQGVQGLDDEAVVDMLYKKHDDVTLLQRTIVKKELLQPGIQRYNMFWGAAENTVISSTSPLTCPKTAWMIPENEQQKEELGFHKYHCYNSDFLKMFDDLFSLDKTINSINAGIIYYTPAFYRYKGCTGFPWNGGFFKGGCVPRADAMDDWEDYVNLLAWRYSERSAANPLTHWVIWNEVASAGWLDYSPILPNRAGVNGSNPLGPHQMDQLTQKYADMLFAAQRAVRRHTRKALLWVSTDRLWLRPHQKEGDVLHVGEHPFLEHLWPKVGIQLDWGLVVHPYGKPMENQWDLGQYTFISLNNVINYQREKLMQIAKIPPNGLNIRPQQLLYAAEQGWQRKGNPDPKRALYICSAHNISTTMLYPNMIAVTHNFFQDTIGSNSQNGQDFGLVDGPPKVFFNLSNAVKNSDDFNAYVSTSVKLWGKTDAHYCCAAWKLGCKGRY